MSVVGLLVAGSLAAGCEPTGERLVLGGNPQGSQLYPMSNAIAATVSRNSPLRVDVLPQGAGVFYPMMASGEVDVGLVNPMDAASAARGEPPYDQASRGQGFRLRTLMLGSPIAVSIVAAADAGISSIEELAGRRLVANYGAFASAGLTAEAVLASAGLSLADVEVVTVSSYPEGVRAVIEGRADAATGSIGSAIIRELDVARGARFLPVDPGADSIARVRAVGSAFEAYRAAAGQPGIAEDTWVIAYELPLVARADLDEERAYTFVKTLYEHHAELGETYAPLSTWTPDRFADTAVLVPYHPGAIRLYRERGLWNAQLDARQRELAGSL